MWWRHMVAELETHPLAGLAVLAGGTLLSTLLILAIGWALAPLPNPGIVYLPLVAMLAYHWGWRYALAAAGLELVCVYLLFIPPAGALKPFGEKGTEQLVTLAAVTVFVLALVQLARSRRALAEREAGRFAALNHIGAALTSELQEAPLLDLIAQTARDLTGAEFAAFTLRPVNAFGQPLVPSEGGQFRLAAVVGVTPEQEAQLRRMHLGGEGLLAPIFRHGVPVRVPDAAALVQDRPAMADSDQTADGGAESPQGKARHEADGDALGSVPLNGLRAVGIPEGHPEVRSFLGVPMLDSSGQVRGGLLLGHSQPDHFTPDDQALLVGLAAQAAVALENARLYRAAQVQARELDATFESIVDGITVVDDQGRVVLENAASRGLREALDGGARAATSALLRTASARTMAGQTAEDVPLTIAREGAEPREYIVSASPLRRPRPELAAPRADGRPDEQVATVPDGAVVVWHDVTEAHRLLVEQRARAEAEAGRTLLQAVIDELPSAVYLVRGRDARLVLANRAAEEVWGAPWPEQQPMSDFLLASAARVFAVDGRPLQPDELSTLRTARTGEAVRHRQEIIRQPNGTTLPILCNAVPVDPRVLGWTASLEADGTQASEPAVLVVLQDVSALKAAERLKDEFIGIAAHELRNPMAALRGFAQMLTMQTARGKGTPLADWQREAIEALDQSTARLVELTDDLLDVTRLQGGRLELRPAPTDLVALVRRVVARLQVTSGQHHISVKAQPEHIVAEVDPSRIEQVLNNLINNAIKYSPAGGAVDIVLRENAAASVAELYVRDHGIGIPADQQARIFSRFARANNARDQGITGTGLGLYLSRELVERHGGRIWFESVEGEGSTFYVTLPLATERVAEAPQMVAG
jgi:signal transduction histidine kinase/GAF domain-containing protein